MAPPAKRHKFGVPERTLTMLIGCFSKESKEGWSIASEFPLQLLVQLLWTRS
jgi:hypothetical protein